MRVKKWTRLGMALLIGALLLPACKSASQTPTLPAADEATVKAVADTFMQAISESDHHRSFEMFDSVALNNVGSYAEWVQIAEQYKGVEWTFTNISFSRINETDAQDNLAALLGSGSVDGNVVYIMLGLAIENNTWKVEALKFTLST